MLVQSDGSELITDTTSECFFGACVLSATDPPVLQLVLIPLFDGPRFDSLLPVSVKAELNVNQAARLGGT